MKNYLFYRLFCYGACCDNTPKKIIKKMCRKRFRQEGKAIIRKEI